MRVIVCICTCVQNAVSEGLWGMELSYIYLCAKTKSIQFFIDMHFLCIFEDSLSLSHTCSQNKLEIYSFSFLKKNEHICPKSYNWIGHK